MNAHAHPDLRATLTQRLAAELRDLILDGAFQPGTPLREAELSARYEVSRHVIREVLRTLAADGLVDYASFRGARVPVLTEADARDIYRARRMVECGPEAMTALTALPDLAALRRIHRAFEVAVKAGDWRRAFDLDVEFHRTIMAADGEGRACAWLAALLQDLRLAHLVAPSFNREAFMASVAQHAEVLEAIEADDREAARAAMRRHLESAEAALIADMGGTGEIGA